MIGKSKKTALNAVGFPVCKHRTNSTSESGLIVKITLGRGFYANHDHGPCYCHAVPCRATIDGLASLSECRGRSLLVSNRRLIATSRSARGFSFGGCRNHGTIAPSFFMGVFRHQFLTGSRGGGSRASRSLLRGNSYPPRPALPVGKGEQIKTQAIGISAMMRTLSRGVSSEFPSSIEPIYRPVESRVKRERVCLSVNPLPSIATASETLLQRLSVAKVTTDRLPSIRRARARVQLRKCLSELIFLCNEVEALSATSRGC